MAQVDIIMAAYNAEHFIIEAINSLLKQTLTDFKLFVIDDASTDATVLSVNEIQDDRVSVIKMGINKGVSAARNRALEECTAPFIAIMDADDISQPTRLEKQVKYLIDNQDVVAVGSWLYLLSPRGKSVYFDRSPPSEISQVMEELFSTGGGIYPGTAVMRADIVQKVGGYRKGFPSSEDLDLLLRMTQYGLLANLPECLYGYRLNPNGLTFSSKLRRDHYSRLALELWQERKERGIDRLDEGEELADLSVSMQLESQKDYSLNQVLSYFYKQDANDKIQNGKWLLACISVIYCLWYQPFYRKNWISVIKLLIGKGI